MCEAFLSLLRLAHARFEQILGGMNTFMTLFLRVLNSNRATIENDVSERRTSEPQTNVDEWNVPRGYRCQWLGETHLEET